MTPFPRTTWTFYALECGDWTATAFATDDETEALEWAEDFNGKRVKFRAIRTDFDVETGAFESASDVTDSLADSLWKPNTYDMQHAEIIADEFDRMTIAAE